MVDRIWRAPAATGGDCGGRAHAAGRGAAGCRRHDRGGRVCRFARTL